MATSRQLLIVDDEEDILDFIERVFRRSYAIERATSVDEAVARLSRGPVDVLITDQRMPRRSGSELLEIARRLHPSAVRILLSGYAETDDGEGCADARLLKPIDADALRAAVESAEARRAAADYKP